MSKFTPFISAFAIAVFLLFSVNATHGAPIFSNISGEGGFNAGSGFVIGDNIPFGNFDIASAFTTPAKSAFSLESIELAASLTSGVNILNVSLAEDFGNAPGPTIEGFVLPISLDPAILTGTSLINPVLSPGTKYWLIASLPGQASPATWFFNSTEDIGPVGSREDLGAWAVSPTIRGAFRVSGKSLSIPEPKTLILFFVGIAAFGIAIIIGLRRLPRPTSQR